jgi:butyrate kinase
MYKSVKGTTQTYKVDNVLATYAFKNQYQAEIGELVTCITRNIGKLQSGDYHPKWRDVDPLDIDRIKWAAHPAAVAAIKRASRK